MDGTDTILCSPVGITARSIIGHTSPVAKSPPILGLSKIKMVTKGALRTWTVRRAAIPTASVFTIYAQGDWNSDGIPGPHYHGHKRGHIKISYTEAPPSKEKGTSASTGAPTVRSNGNETVKFDGNNSLHSTGNNTFQKTKGTKAPEGTHPPRGGPTPTRKTSADCNHDQWPGICHYYGRSRQLVGAGTSGEQMFHFVAALFVIVSFAGCLIYGYGGGTYRRMGYEDLGYAQPNA